jgi:hypothetical protein
LCPDIGKANEIALGYLSFDELIPGSPGSPEVNVFTVGNLTGHPANGGNDLPPTWPVTTTVTFQNATLNLVLAYCTVNCSEYFDLANIGPQFFQSPMLQFPDTAAFASATFSATLDTTGFQLDGGGTFTAAMNQISAVLVPSNGNSLGAGVDSVLISVSDQGAPSVPEPSTFLMLAAPLPFVWRCRKGLR